MFSMYYVLFRYEWSMRVRGANEVLVDVVNWVVVTSFIFLVCGHSQYMFFVLASCIVSIELWRKSWGYSSYLNFYFGGINDM